jgi:hypothetical protein
MTGSRCEALVEALLKGRRFCSLGRLTALPALCVLRSRSARTISWNRRSKACFLARTVQMDTHIELPKMMSRNRMVCCQVVILLRLTVLSPVSVMALTTTNKLSA